MNCTGTAYSCCNRTISNREILDVQTLRTPHGLMCQDMVLIMAAIKISSKVDENVWNQLRSMARDSHRDVSELLTEAIREYLDRNCATRLVVEHLESSIADNRRLGELLAR